ncbi:MAG: TonB-dependent receptor [Bacteroidia bacterium]|nr:TonB-dependent receptor [Bacteroidia bacterium]
MSIKKLAQLIIFSGILLINLESYGQNLGSIKGRVKGNDDKLPIQGAVIRLSELGMGTTSDSLGNFEIKALQPGNYSIQISFMGYENQTIHEINVLPNKISYREIILQTAINSLKSVDINSFRYENNRLNPISAYSFSREEINLNPGAQGDIFRAIGMLPGVSSSGGIYSAISVRGQGVRDNVYMVDDIPLTEVGHLEGNSFFNDPNGGRFSIFAPRVIDNALFLGGGFSSEYGRRSASVLGLTIKEGNNQNAIIDGQTDLLGITINYDGPGKVFKNTNLFVSARYQNFYGLVNLIGLKDIGLPIYGDLILKSSTQLNEKNKLNFIAIISPESFVRDIENVYADKKLNLLYLPDFKRNKMVYGLNLTSNLNRKSSLKNILYFTSYTSDVKVGRAFPETDTLGNLRNPIIPFISNIQSQDYSENKIGYRLLHYFNFNQNNKLATGLELDALYLNNNRRFYFNDTLFVYRSTDILDPNQRYQVVSPQMVNANFKDSRLNLSSFINYSTFIGKRLSVNAGLRYDYTGFSNQHVLAPRLNGSYFINEKQSVNFAYGIFYQEPVYSDMADQPKGNVLKMEETIQYILGYRWYIKPDFKLTIETWYKEFSHLVTTPINGTVFKNNLGNGWGKGFDINLTKRLVYKFHGQISYSYMEIKRNDGDGLGEYNFAFSQPHQFNLMLSYKLNSHWTFSMRFRSATGKPKDDYIIHRNILDQTNQIRYSKEIIGKNRLRLPNFNSLDVRVNYQFKFKTANMTIFFDIVNIMNKQIANSESFNYLTGQNYFDGLAIFPTGGLKFEF